ncbi:MAG TPA: hypothetical protein VN414_13540 [Methanosarcina sp.]|nr:hypothetical protein [Methanosarcina sp.]
MCVTVCMEDAITLENRF